MHHQKDLHTESALYWSAVSLIVCEGLSVGAAAKRLGIEDGRLRNILRRRRRHMPSGSLGPNRPVDECH
jgi:DNA-directed RNA polymerase specialized sigma24 family protein